MRVATDKLLFLSQRAFADEEPEDGLCSWKHYQTDVQLLEADSAD